MNSEVIILITYDDGKVILYYATWHTCNIMEPWYFHSSTSQWFTLVWHVVVLVWYCWCLPVSSSLPSGMYMYLFTCFCRHWPNFPEHPNGLTLTTTDKLLHYFKTPLSSQQDWPFYIIFLKNCMWIKYISLSRKVNNIKN